MIMKLHLNLMVVMLMSQLITAQTVDRQVAASGGYEFTNSSGTITYTIGEPVTETLSSGNATATQGFHQGVINITSIDEQMSDVEISIYPNPTSDFITVNFSGKAIWNLHSLEGKLISTGQLVSGTTDIDMRAVALATYMLSIIDDDDRINTYRVVKTH